MLNKLLTSWFLLASLGAKANLYQCEKPNGKLVPVENKSIEFEYKTQSAIWFPKALEDVNQNKDKIPFLIYYAIDTEEPFMKYSTAYETRKLKESCSKNQNFAIVLNSKFVDENKIEICKSGILQTINLSDFPKLNSRLIVKKKFIGRGDHETNELGPMRYLVKYKDITRSSFAMYPLAHPDFLYSLIDFLIEEQTLFPTEKYIPLINLKSHGSEQTVLSGLYSCQIKAKSKSQNEILLRLLNRKERNTLNEFTESNLMNLNEVDKILDKINLGTISGLGKESNRGQESNLGRESSLGNAYFSLGSNDGLGTDLAFGLYHVALNAVLNDLFNKSNNRYLGFLMLESCDTNRDIGFNHANQNNILGIYSAQYSLWYRNLNWWTILKISNGSMAKILETLDADTSKIQNLKPKIKGLKEI